MRKRVLDSFTLGLLLCLGFPALTAEETSFAGDIQEFADGAVQRLELEGLPKVGQTDFKVEIGLPCLTF